MTHSPGDNFDIARGPDFEDKMFMLVFVVGRILFAPLHRLYYSEHYFVAGHLGGLLLI